MSLNAKPKHLRDNRFLDGTPTATDTDSGSEFDVLNIKDWRYETLWKAASSGTKYLTIDSGSAQAVDSFFVANHNFFTATATISVESSTTGVWGGEEVEQLAGFTPPDDKAFMKTFTQVTIRYWRIKIVTGAIAPYCGVVLLGAMFTYEKYPMAGFDPNIEKVMSETNKSLAGYPLGTIINYYERPIDVKFRLLSPSWVTNTFAAEWTHMRQGLPVAFAWDITNHSTEVYYGAIPVKFTLKMPYDPTYRTLNLKLDTIVED